MNSWNGLGRLTRDPEVRYAQSGTAVVNFTLAVDRRFKKEGQQEVDFINCVAFGKTGELVQQYVKKSNQLAVTGRLAIDQYVDKEGNNKSAPKIVVEAMSFVSAPKKDNHDAGGFVPVNQALEDEEDLPF